MSGPGMPSAHERGTDVSRLRPYLLTSGRAQPVDDTLEIEAQVLSSDLGTAAHHTLAFELREIITLCRTTRSVAEIGAVLGLHIGVARVLVADLAALRYVMVRRPGVGLAHDLGMIERVIRGLEAIR
ncbi:MAG: DUF742 domain-containing protein [Actinomycetota bacterium]|nr:DUF742 domain-containing protein [Actinomycetota bacterium]MDQ3579162.1 DUF742 domain-containing protein [Actinomycetota bacterium]